MLLKSICSFSEKNYFQSIFVLFSKFVVVYMIFSVSVCKKKIISNSEKNNCVFWFISSIFIYFCCWILSDECYFRIVIFWFCVWFSSYVCLLSWSSHHDLHIFVSFSFCELLHLLLMFIKSRNSWLLIWQVTLCLLWVVLWTLLDSLYIALLLLK